MRGVRDDACAVVVFADETGLPWLRWLRPGFRHCFVVVRRGGAWVAVNPLAHRTEVELAPACLARDGAEVAHAYERSGATCVVAAVVEPPRRLAPVRPHTCVEVVKRVLGLRAPWVLTPWQLYRFLHSNEYKNLIKEKILDNGRQDV